MKFWKIAAFVLLALVSIVVLAIFLLYKNQDQLVQKTLKDLNKGFNGSVFIKDSHIALFQNFPYVSIDLENVVIKEDKNPDKLPIAEIRDAYIGFDLWPLLKGKTLIKKIKLKDGHLNLITYSDGSLNIANALAAPDDTTVNSNEEQGAIQLKEIVLENVKIYKTNVASKTLVDAHITTMRARFKANSEDIKVGFETKFDLNLMIDKDTTFLKNKHLELSTAMLYTKQTQVLDIEPTVVFVEGASFKMQGKVDFLNDLDLDLLFEGNKPNFDLVFALIPEDLTPIFKKYENQGSIFFDASIKGKSINGFKPAINAKFGAEKAYFNNQIANKKLDDLHFVGSFTNGENRDATTMELMINDFSAKPEAGNFSGNLRVVNFNSPDITLKIIADFELDFLAKFFNITNLADLKGKVNLTMNFRDIIDINFPEKSIERLNESYFTQLKIENLSFANTNNGIPVKSVSLYAEMNGHNADLKYCNVQVGNSDFNLSGNVSDLPAILHHTNTKVITNLALNAKKIDLFELSGSDSASSFKEVLHDLKLNFSFIASAKAFTESPFLPIGQFKINNLFVKPNNYPHTLHDFNADVIIDTNNLIVNNFKGFVDESDFHFIVKLKRYDLWFLKKPTGDTQFSFDLDSKLIRLDDLFVYNDRNYVPQEYQHEEFKNLILRGVVDFHFKDTLQATDLQLLHFGAKLKLHPLAFENFEGQVHIENENLQINQFSGKMGSSDFTTTLHYYWGKNEQYKKRVNKLKWYSTNLNLDELVITSKPIVDSTGKVDHDAGFNLYELPFPEMNYDFQINKFSFNKYKIDNFKTTLRTNSNHYLYVDTLFLKSAGGSLAGSGYFNGSNPKAIYFSPNLYFENIDLDQFMVKFDNFGQDNIVADQLHGFITGNLKGKLNMHADLVPIIDQSKIEITATIINGRLENYPMFDYMADYFKNKNLKKVRFDTLTNTITIDKGVMQIPNMTINSSLGFMQISGSHSLDQKMDYALKIPWNLVRQAASSKLFGKKETEIDPEINDDIIAFDPDKKTRFLNLRVNGTTENFKISVGKAK